MRLNQNIPSLNVYTEYCKNLNKQSNAMNRIHSGLKVATAKDDPNKLASSEHMKIQMRSLQMASRNTQDTISMLETVDGAANNISQSLVRMKELVVQAGGTASPEDKAIIQQELDMISESINDIANSTEFNGKKIMTGAEKIKAQIGSEVGETTEINMFDFTSRGLGIKIENLKVEKPEDIDASLEMIEKSINTNTSYRSKLGAIANRLDSNVNIVEENSLKIQNAESKLTGADIAEEMVELTSKTVLVNAGISLMAQSNKLPQDVLSAIQNIGKK
ncbi:flagellin [Clostridium ihumii]|uniref:flagellin N-terminal helical domain-containing protein n=1 Tax=Clostridium ihumii TaxID=1470356 RepID=UPI00058C3BE0|nr:flagellin [Clostridium ihumii]